MMLLRVALLFVLLAAGGLLLFWLTQRRLIYYPLAESVPPVASVLPRATEVRLATSDGLALGAWWLLPEGTAPFPAAIVFNGNAGDRAGRADLAEGLAEMGLAVLLFDYRGYGGNPGHPSEAGLAHDARAARAFLEARPEVDPARVVYVGESLGAAVALGLALEQPPAVLILRSPFTSLVEVGRVHYPWLPVKWLLVDRFPTNERIGRLGSPLLVVAGDGDQVVPESQSRRVFAAATVPKRYVAVPAADHNHAGLVAGPPLLEPIERFLAEHGILEAT